MNLSNQLYSFKEQDNRFGAPKATPVRGGSSTGGANNISNTATGFSLYDIINDFQWTTSPAESKVGVPEIYLKEKRLITNSFVAQAAYYTYAIQESVTDATNFINNFKAKFPLAGGLVDAALGAILANQFGGRQISQVVGNVTEALPQTNPFASIIQSAFQVAGGAVGASIGGGGVLNNLSRLAGDALDIAQTAGANLNVESLNSKYLLPYEGLYLTEDTEFYYRFPYFVNNLNDISNRFSNTPNLNPAEIGGPGGAFYGLSENLGSAALTVAANANMNAPGIYIEKPKFYNFSEDGEALIFKFPLVNTGWATYTDVLRNWQLLYLLAYQNRPNRRSRDLIDPPVIYEVSIPGSRYYPYAYIETMKVAFVGSVRKMLIDVPYGTGTIKIESIIPDAYDVTITLRALVRESQNFLYSMLYDKYNIISTSSTRTLQETQGIIGVPTEFSGVGGIFRQAAEGAAQ
jgi:hypothetical protein